MPVKMNLGPEEMEARRRAQARERQTRARERDREAIAAVARPIPCPSAKALRTVEGLGILMHRLIRAVLSSPLSDDAKARTVAPYLRTLTELVSASVNEKLREAIESCKRGDVDRAIELVGQSGRRLP